MMNCEILDLIAQEMYRKEKKKYPFNIKHMTSWKNGFVVGVKYGLKQHEHEFYVKSKKLKAKIAELEKEIKDYDEGIEARV